MGSLTVAHNYLMEMIMNKTEIENYYIDKWETEAEAWYLMKNVIKEMKQAASWKDEQIDKVIKDPRKRVIARSLRDKQDIIDINNFS